MKKRTTIPTLGDEVAAQIITSAGDNFWKAEFATLPSGWSAVLRSRSAKLYESGDRDSFWIYGIVPECFSILLSDSDFGRLPISDRMRPRYLCAIQAGLSVLSSSQDISLVNPIDLSELKGMFNRCVRKDQWDWLSVFDSLGRPSFTTLKVAADYLGQLAAALKYGKAEETMRYRELLSSCELTHILESSLSDIEKSVSHLSHIAPFRPISDKHTQKEEVKEESGLEPYIISHVARAKQERANIAHRRTLQILVATLENYGFIVEHNPLVDAYCRLKTGPAFFEVKSVSSGNERAQCRHALSQLYEYRYLHTMADASLWLVLSEPPKISWIIDYMQSDRGIQILWVDGKSLTGPSYNYLFTTSPRIR